MGVYQENFDWQVGGSWSKFNFVAEYPTWASIKRTLTGKLVVDGQNFI